MPRTARIGPIETTGFEGQITIASADPIASSTPGAGDAAETPSKRIALTSSRAPRRTQYSWKCRSSSCPSATTSSLVSTRSSVIGRIVTSISNRAAIARGHLRQGQAVGQRSCPEQVRRQVEVAEPEPRGVAIEGRELLGRSEGLVAPAPPALPVERVAEPIRDRIEVGTHPEPVDVDVVAGVHDRRDVDRRHGADEPAQELPRTDTSCERDDLHERRA